MQFIIFTVLAAISLMAKPSFEQNRGQVQTEARYFTSNSGTAVQFTAKGVEFLAAQPGQHVERLLLTFPGATSLNWIGEEPESTTYTYLTTGGAIDARRYARVTARQIHKGVDLVFYFKGGKLEYDFVVAPLADASQIEIRFDGDAAVHRNSDEFNSQIGQFPWRQRAPHVYQGDHVVRSGWKATGDHAFRLAPEAYNTQQPLIVDPVIEFASYISGEAEDEVVVVSDTFIAGHTNSRLIDGIAGQPRKGRDIFVRMLLGAGSTAVSNRLWRDRVFLFGGSGDDTLAAATVGTGSSSLSLTLAGTTTSRDLPFPATSNQYLGGASDGFLATINLNLSSPVLGDTIVGQYIGGSGEDRITCAQFYVLGLFVAGTTDSPDLPVAQAPQASPGGGRDAFFGRYPTAGDRPVYLSYFGGSGDESASAIRIASLNRLYLGGETGSQTVDDLEGSLAGETDGYLLVFRLDGTTVAQEFSRRIGGAQRDRVTAIAVSQAGFEVAGETNSSDLRMEKAAQQSLAGGTDAFLYRYSPQGELNLGTYWGGTGDEHVTEILSTSSGQTWLAGYTTSTDLKMARPVQDANRGGIDGYVALLDPAGATAVASYFGGTGDDVIRSLYVRTNGPLAIAGTTSSTDLPEVLSLPATDRGGRDGFVAELAFEQFQPPSVLYALKEGNGASFGSSWQMMGSSPTRVRVKDPSKVLLVVGETRAAEIELPRNASFGLVALAAQGETEVEFSAPGFATATVPVRIGELLLSVTPPTNPVHLFVRSFTLEVGFRVIDTVTGRRLTTTEARANGPSILPGTLTWKSSNPDVLAIPSQQTTNPSGATPTIQVRGAGTAILSAEGHPTEPITIEVTRGQIASTGVTRIQYTTPTAVLDQYFNPALPLGNSTGLVEGDFQLESENPDLLLVGSTADGPFSPSMSIRVPAGRSSVSYYIKALASSGTATLRLSSASLDRPATATYSLVPATLLLGAQDFSTAPLRTEFTVQPNQDLTLGVHATFADRGLYIPLLSDVRFESSDPSIVSIQPAAGLTARARALREGIAELRVITNNPHVQAGPPTRVTVSTRTVLVPITEQLHVGQRLQVPFRGIRNFDPPTPTTFTVTVDDPGVVGLTTAQVTTPAGRLEVPRLYEFFNLVGLARGRTTLRLSGSGYQDLTLPLIVAPSGFAFDQERLNLESALPTSRVTYQPYVLHPDTMEPLEVQSLAPGITQNVRFEQTGLPLTLDRTECRFPVNCAISITTGASPGESFVTPIGVEGFDVSPTRTRLSVRSGRSAVSILPVSVKDCVIGRTFSVLATGLGILLSPIELTVTSLDPDLFLLSSSATAEPQESIRIRTDQTLFVHGVGAGRVGRLKVEATGVRPLEVAVPALSSTVTISDPSSSATSLDLSVAQTRTLSVNLTSSQFESVLGVSSRVPSLPLRVESSRSDAVSLAFPQGQNFSGATTRLRLDVTGAASGMANLVGNVGSVAGRPFAVNVTAPRFVPLDVQAAALMRRAVTVALNRQTAINQTLTVRALDPSRARVQTAGSDQPGVESASFVLPAGSNSVSFELDGLATSGESQIELSGGDLQPIRIGVYHTVFALRFESVRLGSLSSGAEATVRVYLELMPRRELIGVEPVSVGYVPSPGLDLSKLTISVDSENPEVVSVLQQPVFEPNSLGVRQLRIRGGANGSTLLRLRFPQGFGSLPEGSGQTLQVTVNTPQFQVECAPLFYEAVSTCRVQGVPAGTTPTVRSANPNRILVGSASSSSIVLQSLARSGTTEVTIDVPGYQTITLNLQHNASGFAFDTANPAAISVQGTASLPLQFVGILPDGSTTPLSASAYRPNAFPATVLLRASDPSVASLSADRVTFTSGLGANPSVTLRGLKAGQTSIEIVTPTGFSQATPRVISVTVR